MSGASRPLSRGLALLELTAILLAVCLLPLLLILPSRQEKAVLEKVKETLMTTEEIQRAIDRHYQDTGRFPTDNSSVEIPVSGKYAPLYTRSILIDEGVIHIAFGNRIHKKARNKTLTLRPAFFPARPRLTRDLAARQGRSRLRPAFAAAPHPANTHYIWICGNESIPEGMNAIGENRTTLPDSFLPPKCRRNEKPATFCRRTSLFSSGCNPDPGSYVRKRETVEPTWPPSISGRIE
jgi:type IV pilus assembly protein PilA